MRILTFASLFPNSVDPTYGIFIYQRAKSLAQRPGNHVEVVSPVPYFPRWLKSKRWYAARVLPKQEQFDSLLVHHPRYFLIPGISMWWHAFSMFLGCLPRMISVHRQQPVDCVDAHFIYPDGLAAVLLGKYLGVPVVLSARGTDINVYPNLRVIRPQIRWALEKADAVIAVSDALKRSMTDLAISPDKIRVIANGVDANCFRPVANAEARRRLGILDEKSIIVSVGSLVPSKGHELLIRAFALVAPRHNGLRLFILGEGPHRKALESLVAQLGLIDSIQLPGKRPNAELPFWFSAAKLSCLATEREGWPNVLTESLSCGTPVIATRVGGIPEIIHSDQLGILVNQTEDSIAAGIEEGLTRNWNREEISRQTRTRTWDTVAFEVEEVLRQAVLARGRREQTRQEQPRH